MLLRQCPLFTIFKRADLNPFFNLLLYCQQVNYPLLIVVHATAVIYLKQLRSFCYLHKASEETMLQYKQGFRSI